MINFNNETKFEVITSHAGNKPNNGGEYAHSYKLIPFGDGKWHKEYCCSADFEFCEILGDFRSCNSCPYFEIINEDEDKGCTCKYETMSFAEIQKLLNENSWSWDSFEDRKIIVNATGHKYISCKYEGGCVACYPCNHADCLD